MTTRKRVTPKDGEEAIAMLDRERTDKTTGYATEMRRCIGSERFGIEAHEAPVSTFPVQPSRKDGLGLMCAEHWKAYVKRLREARAAAKPTAPKVATKPAIKASTRIASKPAAKATTKRERRRTPMAHIPDAKVVEAEALIAEVDALPGPEHVQRVGDDDVQAALETVNGSRHEASAETPLGEAVDGGAEEASAA